MFSETIHNIRNTRTIEARTMPGPYSLSGCRTVISNVVPFPNSLNIEGEDLPSPVVHSFTELLTQTLSENGVSAIATDDASSDDATTTAVTTTAEPVPTVTAFAVAASPAAAAAAAPSSVVPAAAALITTADAAQGEHVTPSTSETITSTDANGTFDPMYNAPGGYKSRLRLFFHYFLDGKLKDRHCPLPQDFRAMVEECLQRCPTRIKRGGAAPAELMKKVDVSKAFKKYISYETQSSTNYMVKNLNKKGKRLNSDKDSNRHYQWVKVNVLPNDVFTFKSTTPAINGRRTSMVATYRVMKRDDVFFFVQLELLPNQKVEADQFLKIPWSSVSPVDASSGTCMYRIHATNFSPAAAATVRIKEKEKAQVRSKLAQQAQSKESATPGPSGTMARPAAPEASRMAVKTRRDSMKDKNTRNNPGQRTV